MPFSARRPPAPSPPYLVAGQGRAGRAAAHALCALAGPEAVHVWDGDTGRLGQARAERLRRRGITVWLGETPRLSGPLEGATVIKSPGVSFGAPLIAAAARAGMPIMDELELGWRLVDAPLVAVTGTNGKSTMCALLAAVAQAAGRDAQVAGNTDFGSPLSAHAGGPPPLIICEVSSYQLEGCSSLLPDAAVLTTVEGEHLHRHGTMDAYVACKRGLFVRGDTAVGVAAICTDGPWSARIAGEVRDRGGRVVAYGRDAGADYRLRRCRWTASSGWLQLDGPDGRIEVATRLPGEHNALNVVGAIAAGRALGVPLDTVLAAVQHTPGVPGRFERIAEGQPFEVIVDFAHTPQAVAWVLAAARALLTGAARLHVLMSVAGDRYPGHSRPMGELAARAADRVILSEGSGRGHDRARVMAPLIAGARSVPDADVEVIVSRREAVTAVLDGVEPGDVVLVLGRGALPRLLSGPGDPGRPFDDRQVVRADLQRRLSLGQAPV